MFVFWYCHKRGKEVRLAKEAEGIEGAEESGADDTVEEDEGEDEYNDLGGEGKYEEMQKYQQMLRDVESKADSLSKPAPSDVPLPDEKDEKNLET